MSSNSNLEESEEVKVRFLANSRLFKVRELWPPWAPIKRQRRTEVNDWVLSNFGILVEHRWCLYRERMESLNGERV